LRIVERDGGGLLAEAEAAIGTVLAVAVPPVVGVEETKLDGMAAAN
jgi:hypothetical protein